MEPRETLWPWPHPEAVHATMHLGHTNQHCVLSSLHSGASKITATLGVPFTHSCSPLNLTWFPPGGGGKSPVWATAPGCHLRLLVAQAWAQMSGHLMHQL